MSNSTCTEILRISLKTRNRPPGVEPVCSPSESQTQLCPSQETTEVFYHVEHEKCSQREAHSKIFLQEVHYVALSGLEPNAETKALHYHTKLS